MKNLLLLCLIVIVSVFQVYGQGGDLNPPNAICQDANISLDGDGTGDIFNTTLVTTLFTEDWEAEGFIGGGSFLTNWNVIGNIDVVYGVPDTYPILDSYWLDIDGNTSNATITTKNTFDLVAGETYLLTFEHSNNQYNNSFDNQVEVNIGSYSEVFSPPADYLLTEFKQGILYTPEVNETINLQFKSLGTASSGGSVLDNIEFSQVTGDLIINNGSNATSGIRAISAHHTCFTCEDIGVNVVNMVVTANNGLTDACSANVTVDENTPPIITCQANINLFATSAAGAIVNYTIPEATDNCEVNVAMISGFESGSVFPVGTTTVTYEATDVAGNSAQCSFDVTVSGSAPEIICPANILVENETDQCGAIVDFAATETSGTPASTISYSIEPMSFFAIGTTTVTATATNPVGTSSCTFEITVEDSQLPTIVAADQTIYLDENGQAEITLDMVDGGSFDNCGIDFMELDQMTFDCSHLASDIQNEQILTTEVSSWMESTETHDGLPSSNLWPGVVAALPGINTYTLTPVSGGNQTNNDIPGAGSFRTDNNVRFFRTTFDIQNNTAVSFEALLSVDNAAQVFINGTAVALEQSYDADNFTTPFPAFRIESDGSSTNGSSIGGQDMDQLIASFPSSLFNVGENEIIIAVRNPSDEGTNSGGVSAEFTISETLSMNTPVVFTVHDLNGNSSSETLEITVLDEIAPEITCPANVEIYATSANGAIFDYSLPVVTDNCGATVELTSGLASGSLFPIGTTTQVFEAVDASGNSVQCSFDVVVSGLAPEIVCPANTIVGTDTDQCGAFVDFAAIETTAIPASTISYSIEPNSFFETGTTTVTATATNPVGTSSCSFEIIVEDIQHPTILTQNASIVLDANGMASISIADIDNNSYDNCLLTDISPSQTDFDCSHLGVNEVTLTLSDASNNTTTATALVTVIDEIAPEITCSANMEVYATSAAGAIVNYDFPAATDNCSATVSLVDGFASGSTFPIGTTTLNFQAIDAAGNTTVCSFDVTVSGLAPEIICPADIFVENDADQCGALVDFAATETTGIPASTITYSEEPMSFFPSGTTTVTATATNPFGTSSCTFEITVEDTQLPTIVAADQAVYLDENGQAEITLDMVDAGSYDNCGIDFMELGQTSFDCNDLGSNLVTLSVYDINGLMTQTTVTVNVEDQTAPNIDGIATDFPVPASILNNVSEASGFNVVYELDIPNNADWDQPSHIPYLQNNAAALSGNNVSRVAYFMQLDDQWVWVSMDAFTNDLSLLGIPTGSTQFQQIVSNMNVVSNSPNVTTGDGIATGNIEMWANCYYGTTTLPIGGSGNYDYNDQYNSSLNCYGSFQVHNYGAQQTIFGMNSWSNPNPIDLGIGNQVGGSGHSDWTFAYNAGTYSVKKLYILVDGASNEIAMDATIYLNENGLAELTTDLVMNSEVTDNCGITSATLSQTTFDCSHLGVNEVTLTLSDASNNTNTATALVTVIDEMAPEIICSANMEVYATSAAGAIVNYDFPAATDNCSATVSLVDGFASGSTFPIGTSTVSFEAVDASGNTAVCSFDVTVSGLAPEIICPADLFVENETDQCGAIVDFAATETTGIPASTISYSIEPMSFFASGTTTVTATATNPVGTSSCTFEITVEDSQLPTIVAADQTIYLDENGQAAITLDMVDAGSFDNCGIDFMELDQMTFDCSHLASDIQNEQILTTEVSSWMESSETHDGLPGSNLWPGVVSALPNLDTYTITPSNGGNGTTNDILGAGSFQTDNNVRFFRTTFDIQNNTAVSFEALMSVDNAAQVFINGTAVALEQSYDAANFTAPYPAFRIESDGSSTNGSSIGGQDVDQLIASFPSSLFNVGENEIIIAVRNPSDEGTNSGGVSAEFTISETLSMNTPVVFTVHDINGNSSSAIVEVTVLDEIAPEITCPANVEIYATSANGAIFDYSLPIATDNCGATVELTSGLASGSVFPIGTTTQVFEAVDASGNSVQCSFDVVVSGLAPEIVCPANIIIGTDPDQCGAIVDFAATETSAIPASTISYSIEPNSFFETGTTTVTATATNPVGTSSCSFEIIVEDIQSPTILTQNVSIVLDANGMASISVADIDNNSYDNCLLTDISLSQTDFDCGHIGDNTVELTAVDAAGNSASAFASVTVVDETAPVALTQDLIIELDANGIAYITTADIDAGSSDACGIESLSLSQTAFDCSHVGDNTVVLTAVDVNGNQSTMEATVTVQDQVAPAMAVQDIVIELDANGIAYITTADIDAGSSDACGIESLSLSQTAFDCSHVGDNTVTLTAFDVNGNQSTIDATVTVQDNIAPDLAVQDIVIELDANGSVIITTADIDAGSSDACGIESLSLSQTDFDCSHVGDNTVTLTAFDVNGNSATMEANVSVVDLIAPAMAIQDIVVELDATGNASITTLDIDAGTSDACGIESLSLSQTAFNCSHVGDNVVVLTAIDVNGNEATMEALVSVEDPILPTITSPEDVSVFTDLGLCQASNVDIGMAVAADNCSFEVSNDAPEIFPHGETVVTWMVVDASGNTSTSQQTITVIDNEAPSMLCLGELQNRLPNFDGCSYVEIDGELTPTDLFDNCSSDLVLSYELSGATMGSGNSLDGVAFELGTTTITWTLTDESQNQTSCSFDVLIENNLQTSISSPTFAGDYNISCFEGNNGSIELSVLGGTEPYTYSWNNGSIVEDPSELSAGTYAVTVTDVYGCTTENSITLTEPSELWADAGVNHEICYSFSTMIGGSSPALGGVEPYSYEWSPAIGLDNAQSANPMASPTETTIYTLTITDANGCTDVSSMELIVNPLPVASIEASTADDFCNGVTLTAFSSTTEGQYDWSRGDIDQSIFLSIAEDQAGIYSVYVTDQNSCTSAEAAEFTYEPENESSSYSIIGFKEVEFGQYNTMMTGSLGVTDHNKKAKIKRGAKIDSPGSFVKADKIYAHHSAEILNKIYEQATPSLPTMLYNTQGNISGHIHIHNNTTTTINEEYTDIKIRDYCNVVITGSVFGKIEIGKGSVVTFTSASIDIEKLKVQGKNYYYPSTVIFEQDAQVRVKESVEVGKYTSVNPDHNQVVFFIGEEECENGNYGSIGGNGIISSDEQEHQIRGGGHGNGHGNGNGNDDDDDDDDDDNCNNDCDGHKGQLKIKARGTVFNASAFVPRGDIYVSDNASCNNPAYITGQFIANKVKATAKYVVWNSNSCNGEVPAAPFNPADQFVIVEGDEEAIAETETLEDLQFETTYQVYPVPNKGIFTAAINSQVEEVYHISIYSAIGELIFEKKNIEVQGLTEEVIDFQHVVSGVYHVVFWNDQQRFVKKVPINR